MEQRRRDNSSALTEKKNCTRRSSFKDLPLQLIMPHLHDRIASPGFYKILALNINEILFSAVNANPQNASQILGSNKMDKCKKCFYCKHKGDKKNVLLLRGAKIQFSKSIVYNKMHVKNVFLFLY